MGLLDEAIREHLELKRRRGVDAGEVTREESEALGPVRRGPDGAPEMSANAPSPPSSEPYPGDETHAYHDPDAYLAEPAWDDATTVHGSPAHGHAAPADYEHPADATFEDAPYAGYEPAAPASHAYGEPAAAHPHAYDEPATALPKPPAPPFEPLIPRSLTSPRSQAPPEAPPRVVVTPPEIAESVPEPPREKSRFGGGKGSRLRLRRQAPAADPSPPPEPHAPPAPDEPPAGAPRYEHDDDPPGFGIHDPATAAHDLPSAFEPPPAATGGYAPPPPAYQPPSPPPYQPPAPAGDPAAGEDILEETPEFLEETPDHDRLWFEQRPPRDFDFDG